MVEIAPTDGPGQFAKRLANIERQIAALSTMRRTPFTEIYDEDGNLLGKLSAEGLQFFDASGNLLTQINGDGIAVLDASGTERATLGKLGSEYGLALNDAAGTTELTRIATDGTSINGNDGTPLIRTNPTTSSLLDPDLTSTLTVREPGDQRIVTSGTFETAWRVGMGRIYHDVIVGEVTVSTDTATTAEIRVRDLVSGASTDIKSVPASTNTTYVLAWLHGIDLNANGTTFVLEMRRTGGAGNVACRPNSSFLFTSAQTIAPVATSGGWI